MSETDLSFLSLSLQPLNQGRGRELQFYFQHLSDEQLSLSVRKLSFGKLPDRKDSRNEANYTFLCRNPKHLACKQTQSSPVFFSSVNFISRDCNFTDMIIIDCTATLTRIMKDDDKNNNKSDDDDKTDDGPSHPRMWTRQGRERERERERGCCNLPSSKLRPLYWQRLAGPGSGTLPPATYIQPTDTARS